MTVVRWLTHQVDLHRAGLIVEPFMPQCTSVEYSQLLFAIAQYPQSIYE